MPTTTTSSSLLLRFTTVLTTCCCLSVATSSLGTDLLDFYSASSDDNALISSLSIEFCFALVYPGAGGDTATQIADTLDYSSSDSSSSTTAVDVYDEYVALEATLENAYDGVESHPLFSR